MTTMDTRAPMELFGAHPGVSVIDPSSVLTRLWYFDGKFLRAEGFRLDQEYVRSLVALSNQAVGRGVVHGFDVGRGGGDDLRIEGGLALAPSGRVIHLPQQVDVSVAKLIARSTGEFDPGAPSSASPADFSPCPPERPGEPVTGVPPRPLYVLTVAPAEALCGEEERFGQLCEDACATETDRSVAVEGVRFRVRELRLTLPTSRRVSFSQAHLRSRVASAFFADERRATPSMISGSGLRSDVWCAGAEGVGGEEVALAVFERSGSTTTWLDMWTARRELMEQTPQRYWGWRFAMRPLDVFLAEVLQFQCQLLSLGGDGGGPGGEDACAEERAALTEVDDVLATLARGRRRDEEPMEMEAIGVRSTEAVHERPLEEALAAEGMSAMAQRLTELRARVADALRGRSRRGTGSLLIDGGIVELPSGGYLPVDPSRSVEQQVHALIGPGVDLRFCAVRPDFIPEALQEAQHMERISLTQGIDDPAAIEEVDIFVPGGEVGHQETSIEAFEGRVRLVPGTRRVERATKTGSALTMAAVARDQEHEGWSWSLAAHGEAPHRLDVGRLASAIANGLADGVREAEAEAVEEEVGEEAVRRVVELHAEASEEHERTLTDPSFPQRLAREHVLARERYDRAMVAVAEPARPGASIPDRPIPPDQKRPVSLWFDVQTDGDLRQAEIGEAVPFRLRFSTYSRASTEPLVIDVQVNGDLVVRTKHGRKAGSGAGQVTVVTDVKGTADPLVIAEGQVTDAPPQRLRDLALRWELFAAADGTRKTAVSREGQERRGAQARFLDEGSPRHVQGLFELVRAGGIDLRLDGGWTPAATEARVGPQLVRVADLDLREAAGALDPGSRGRDLGEAVIDLIGTELAVRGRDPGFTAHARQRLFGAERDQADVVRATADWVMFHRRRTKVCAGPSERPRSIRRFRWYHAVVAERADLERFRALAGRWAEAGTDHIDEMRVPDRLDDLGFELVTSVEFEERRAELHSSLVALRTAWSAGDRGHRLLRALVAAPPTGDGVNVERQRLATVTSAVADLIDTSRLQTDALSHIPPEFQASGIDGVFFTVGHRRPDAELSHVLLVRATRKDWDQIQQVAQQLDELDEEVFHSVFTAPATFVARFDGDNLVNRDEVVEWWNIASGVLFAGRVLAPALADLADPSGRVEPWLDALREALGFEQVVDLDQIRWTRDDNDMAVFLVRDEPIG